VKIIPTSLLKTIAATIATNLSCAASILQFSGTLEIEFGIDEFNLNGATFNYTAIVSDDPIAGSTNRFNANASLSILGSNIDGTYTDFSAEIFESGTNNGFPSDQLFFSPIRSGNWEFEISPITFPDNSLGPTNDASNKLTAVNASDVLLSDLISNPFFVEITNVINDVEDEYNVRNHNLSTIPEPSSTMLFSILALGAIVRRERSHTNKCD